MTRPTLTVAATLALAVVASLARADAPRRWEVHLIHHTHVDIGYTQSQDEVMRTQWQNLEQAMDLVDQTRDYPDGARFKWNPEATWPIETWLEQADPQARERFARQVREGSIGLDAFFGNMLTGLCRPEELARSIAFKYQLEKLTGVKIDSAMLTDVPGSTWGLVSLFAQHGIKYFSIGMNRTARLGDALSTWGDKPFYWVSPSGRDRLLCFAHGKGYSWFHTGLNYSVRVNEFTPQRIFRYLAELAAAGYPYEIVPIRYNIGSDNGPPDPDISDIVRDWNEKYPDVLVRLVTVSESLGEFERRYGQSLPEFAGDFTPYWEDGAASTARETALVRRAAEKLGQAQTLTGLLLPDFPGLAFHRAWNEVLLFDEHTWGAYNSISSPGSDFAQVQWEWKRERALEADRMANELLDGALSLVGPGPGEDDRTAVMAINANSWPMTGPVTVAGAGWAGARVVTEAGEPVPSQRLSSGELVFMAREVPGLSARRYLLQPGEAWAEGGCVAGEDRIENAELAVRWSRQTGEIVSIKGLADGREYVNNAFRDGFNEYVYVQGRWPGLGRRPAWARPKVAVKESGPLVCSVELSKNAPGADELKTTITLYAGLGRIDIKNELERPTVRLPEGIHFAFPVRAQDPVVRYDVAWGTVAVDQDQLPGACKNYFTPLRWVDVSGDDGGMAFVLQDAPLFEAGAIMADATRVGWRQRTKHNGAIYSFVMNNYWETNYKADQPGVTAFAYSLFPHRGFDAAANGKRGLEVMRPLIAASSRPGFRMPGALVEVDNENVIVESIGPYLGGEGMEVDLANLADEDQSARLVRGPRCGRIYRVEAGVELVPLSGDELRFGRRDLVRLVCVP